MDSLVLMVLAGLAALAILGLGVKFVVNWAGGKKVTQKNIIAGGDVVGGDKNTK